MVVFVRRHSYALVHKEHLVPTGISVSGTFSTAHAMEALDRESFEFRAHFFSRTLEEELVGCLNGPRGGEALVHLHRIAQQRRVNIDEIIRRERERDNNIIRSRPKMETCVECIPPPKRVFGVDECPICTDTDHFFVLECGHVVCSECIGELKRRCGSVVCPTCRAPSRREWSLESVQESEPPVVGKRKWRFVRMLLNCG